MTADHLDRLNTGLEEDLRLAREARWPDWDSSFEGAVWNASGWVADVAGDLNHHVARHDPARALRAVEAIRKALARHEEAERESVLSERDAGFEAGMYAVLELLAGIYEDEEES